VAAFASIRALEPGTIRHERRALPNTCAKLTVSLRTRYGPLTVPLYSRWRGNQEVHMRLIATIVGTLTLVVLILPVHP